MPKSFLQPEGLYNPSLRFAFTNITTEVFTSYWDRIPIVIQPGETIEVSNTTPIPGAGHAIAVKMTEEMVDKIMMGEAKLDEVNFYKNNPGVMINSYRSPKGSSLSVPAARKIWEDQILRQLDPEEESPALQTIRKQLLQEISGKQEQKADTQIPVPNSIEEFADLGVKREEKPQKAARTKKVNETSSANGK